MTTFGVIYLAVLISLSMGCVLWWLRKVLSSDTVRLILTACTAGGWLIYGYLTF
jgi:hypothetical protein